MADRRRTLRSHTRRASMENWSERIKVRRWLDDGHGIFIQRRLHGEGNGPLPYSFEVTEHGSVELCLMVNWTFFVATSPRRRLKDWFAVNRHGEPTKDLRYDGLYNLGASQGGLGLLAGPGVWNLDVFVDLASDALLIMATGLLPCGSIQHSQLRLPLVVLEDCIPATGEDFLRLHVDLNEVEIEFPGAIAEQHQLALAEGQATSRSIAAAHTVSDAGGGRPMADDPESTDDDETEDQGPDDGRSPSMRAASSPVTAESDSRVPSSHVV
ncbi:a1aef957-066f-4f23-8137-75b1837180f1 [Thermothielavioides terrestris]|uniref:A1aef957-066f-4f23-8137-75b1837180f1 n=1 Tax=Thermothielavioides terrestris TaxID=2587410 RepID=A0A3S4C6H4_9PEZI|nr:a1aef957-066f-4f23-8137-75b1837180f1 [Thermothielavioides terrestris]